MKLLLDTHTALWLFNEHERLTEKVKALLLDERNTLCISIISAWEIAIKTSIGKLQNFAGGVKIFLTAVRQHSIDLLTLQSGHIEIVEMLPFIHRDPFDRLLVATAIAEDMTLITADENIQKYSVKWVW
jgi:PIN domain nuclease of toxin-antitoxin system